MVFVVKDIIVIFKKIKTILISISFKRYISHSENPTLKETKSATINIFRNFYFVFKSFIKVQVSYVFTINLFTIAETAWKSELSYKNRCFFSCWQLFASLQ